jgi:prepilin-type N-terminal cleavage/methylation domain-containing protein
MKIGKKDEKGFTLIEVIVTLVLVGITAALAGMWIVSVANGYIFAKMNASTTQKAQLAMTRLVKEFAAIQSVTTPTSGTQITYTRTDSSLSGTVDGSVTTNGSLLQLNGNTLTDSVSEFTLRYCSNGDLTQPTCPRIAWAPVGATEPSRIIEITLKLTAGNNTPVTFVQRVTPRNL